MRKRQTILVSVPGRRNPVLFREVNPLFSKIKTYVSSSPLVHVVIAAFLGAAYTVVLPAVKQGSVDALTFDLGKAALAAGLLAAGRALILLVPSK